MTKQIKTEKTMNQMDTMAGVDVPEWVKKEWINQVETRDDSKPRTNYQMYMEVQDLYDSGETLDYDVIEDIFELERRDKVDLANLTEFILALTFFSEINILKAQLRGDKKTETEAIARHEERCKLISILAETIGSEMES